MEQESERSLSKQRSVFIGKPLAFHQVKTFYCFQLCSFSSRPGRPSCQRLVASSCRRGRRGGVLFSTRHPAPRATLPGGCRGPHNTGSLRSDPTARVAFGGDVVKRERSYFHFRSWLLSSTPCSSGLVPLLPFSLIKSTFAESVLWGCDTVGNLMMKETKGKPARLKHNRISEIKIFIKLYRCN